MICLQQPAPGSRRLGGSTVGTLFSAFDIARSGLTAAQVQLDVAGHNIANVNREGFSRQRVELVSRVPISRSYGQIGRGVGIDSVNRIRDTFLDEVFREQSPSLADSQLRSEFYTRIEDIFLEPGPNGLSSRLNVFFDSLNDFANNVEELPVRQSVINEAQALSGLLQDTAARLRTLRTNANEEVINFVPEINSLSSRIADLNRQIRILEGGGNPANDLRDDRDLLLDELSSIVNITTRERQDGSVDVLVTGEVLVNGNSFREVETFRNPALDPERNDLVQVRFVDNGNELIVEDGALFGAYAIRDEEIVTIDNDIDELAATIIHQINLIHSQGTGLQGLSGTVSGTNAVTAGGDPLDAAGLPFPITAGSFAVDRYDSSGALIGSITVNVTPGATTLDDIAADLAALGATVTAEGTLELNGPAGETFSFRDDTSGALAALGINGLFTGFDARTIAVSQEIVDDPGLLTSGFGTDPFTPGDNSAALALAEVRNGAFLEGGNATINDFYETIIVELGIDASANLQNLEVETAFIESFQRRRQEISGVSIDEEVTLLLQFQRAFEASARVITVTDRMLETLLNVAL